VWNVFRMEWEQFHNIGEWRAVKSVSVELSDSMLLSHKVPSYTFLELLALVYGAYVGR
jgi:hypothetical protein